MGSVMLQFSAKITMTLPVMKVVDHSNMLIILGADMIEAKRKGE